MIQKEIWFFCVCVLEKKIRNQYKSACQISYRRVPMIKNQPVVSYKRVLTVLQVQRNPEQSELPDDMMTTLGNKNPCG